MKVIVKPQVIQEMRIRKGWTQEVLAELSGIHTRTIQRIENEGQASAQSLAALARSFDVSAQSLQIVKDDSLSKVQPATSSKPAPFSTRYKSRFGQLLKRHDSEVSWAHSAWVGWAIVLMGAMLIVSVIFLTNGFLTGGFLTGGFLNNGNLDRGVIFSVFLPGTAIGILLMLIGRFFVYLSNRASQH